MSAEPRTFVEIERRVPPPDGTAHSCIMRFAIDAAPVGADLVEDLAVVAVRLDHAQAAALGEIYGPEAGLALLDAAEARTRRHLDREEGEA